MKQDLGGDDPVEGRIGEEQLAGVAHLEQDIVLSRAVPLKRLSDERRAQIRYRWPHLKRPEGPPAADTPPYRSRHSGQATRPAGPVGRTPVRIAAA